MAHNGTAQKNGASVHKAVLFVNLLKENAHPFCAEVQRALEARGVAASSVCFEGKAHTPARGDWDIALCLGGDGTVLYTARTVAPWGLPIMPVNLGTLGFIAGVHTNEWQAVFDQWLEGKAQISRRCMLELSVMRNGKQAARFNCLNDAVISASGIAKLINLNVHSELSGGEYVELGPYRCDGLLISTATGSTAYSMAAGGPILDAEMDALILNPICPFTLSNRPLVLPARRTLKINVARAQRSGVLLTVDGQDIFYLEGDDNIIIHEAPYKAALISRGQDSYYTALRTKLNWPLPSDSYAQTDALARGGKTGGDDA